MIIMMNFRWYPIDMVMIGKYSSGPDIICDAMQVQPPLVRELVLEDHLGDSAAFLECVLGSPHVMFAALC